MKLLLTGAGGFIGSSLTKKLISNDNSIRAFVRYNSRADIGLLSLLPKHELDQIDLVLGDLRDPSAVLQAAQGCDLIYHLGALISIPYSYLHPVETVQSNVLGTLNILEAARQLGIPVVHTSTSEVYGTALRVPIDEEHPLQGQSPYSASKIGADKLVEAYYKSFNVPSITVRPFNTYGPGQSARAVIPTIITQALTQDHLNLGSLDTKRDFTYIDDTVAGFLMAGQALLQAVRIHQSDVINESIGQLNSSQSPREKREGTPHEVPEQSEWEHLNTIQSPRAKRVGTPQHLNQKPFPTGSLDPQSGEPLIKDPCETAPTKYPSVASGTSHPAPFLVDYDPAEEGDLPQHLNTLQSPRAKRVGTPQHLNTLQSPRAKRVGTPQHLVSGETFNLGTGQEVTIGEVTEIILKILRKPNLPICQDKERIRPAKSEVMRLLSDNSKAREHLGWQPTVYLEEGLEKTVAWISDHLDKYRIGVYER